MRWQGLMLGMVAAPAAAQMNPAAIGGGLVMPSAINAQAHATATQRHQSARQLDREDRFYCSQVGHYRRQGKIEGASRLAALCRQAGYPIGG